jgi:ligand-binding sensor domain-containing protein
MADGKDGGLLLCNASGRVYQFKEGAFRLLHTLKKRANFYPPGILKDPDNNIWPATDKGLVILPYPYKSEQISFANENIFSLVKDQEQKIWFNRTNGKQTITHRSPMELKKANCRI